MTGVMKLKILLMLAILAGNAQQAIACKCARNPNAPPEGSEEAVKATLEGLEAEMAATEIAILRRIAKP